MDSLVNYNWPGNVRELENVMERATVIGQGPEVQARHLPFCDPESPILSDGVPLALDEVEKQHIRKVLELNQWNISRAAKALEIDRTTLHKKIQKYALSK
jgi:transcriptional regulator with PAS, ATPase and Fis domain